MKKLIMTVMMVLMSVGFVGCGMKTTEIGKVAIEVDKFGTENGCTKVLGTGFHTYGIGKTIVEYPTVQHKYEFTKAPSEDSPNDEAFYFNANGGTPCSVDIGIVAHADYSKADILYRTYKINDLGRIIHGFVSTDIREMIIEEMSKVTVENLYSGADVRVVKIVEKRLKEKYKDTGLAIVSLNQINKVDFPIEIRQTIIAKMNSVQKALEIQNKLAETEAQSKIDIVKAETAKKMNDLKVTSITQQLIDYEKVQNEKLMIDKWNGTVPSTVTIIDGKQSLMLGIK